MIQSIITTPLILTSNTSSVAFPTDEIRTCSCKGCNSWLCHTEGSANYGITEGGLYEIDFNASVSSATAGVVALALFNNGEQLQGTEMAETLATAGDYVNLGIDKKLTVCCKGNSTISVRSISSVPTPTDATTPITTQIPIIGNANISISRKS